MIKGRRVESPSSINTYKQCPRKYHYQYVKKLPTGNSIHLIRGKVVHSALEDFFDIELDDAVIQNFKFLHMRILKLFTKHWKTSAEELQSLGLGEEQLRFYFDESIMMLQNWFNRFKKKVAARMANGENFVTAFENIKPRREEEYRSEEFMIRGYIDAIHEVNGNTLIIDYKTSKKDVLTPAYQLQLSIYAMLYEEKHGRKPDLVGIDFLKSTEQHLPVTDEMIMEAKFQIEQIHASTGSDNIADYPQNPSPLCKWRTGQCDFYDVCFGGVSEEDFRAKHD